ncbi:hypothetical protein QR680_008120 [Steinernema hermaphroditum]|uniref:G-protein coupled receptors family 1 profile domain-containing protein n=1 Tax=Steinernema hermaphroditum TaxID=289476 RepID=A0AA39IGW4_9BILA|nr:hypothetical protein QR680_008120 [Steinernema hermaphroditum]
MFELLYPDFMPTFLSYDHYLGCAIGIVLNTVVVTGLSLKRSKRLGDYRWFVVAHTVNDLISAITMGLLQLCFDFDGTLVMIVNGPFTSLSKMVGKGCFMVFATGFLLNISLLALTFIHRYLQICKKHHLYKFSSPGYVTLMLFIIIFPIILLDMAMIYAYTFSYDFSITASGEMYAVRALYVEDIMSPAFLITSALFLSLTTASYVIVFMCCKKILGFLKEATSSMTEKTKKQQRMLTYVLMLQSITPVFTSSLPAVGMIIGILVQFRAVRWITWTLTATFVWLPAINAVISLAFIAPLRSMFQKQDHKVSFKVVSLMSYKK